MKKNILTHIGVVVAMLAISAIYFMPIMQGKALPQGDLQKYEGMAKAQKDYHSATGEYSTWCPSMFSGMPGYQITNDPQHSVFQPVKNAVTLTHIGWERNIGIIFLYLVLLYRAGIVAQECEHYFPALLAMGLAILMVAQAMFNMMVAVGLAPVTGQPLPFISRGGSSTLANCIYVGVILSISISAPKRNRPETAVKRQA